MSESNLNDKNKIKELENLLIQKDNELQKYRVHLKSLNDRVIELIHNTTTEIKLSQKIQNILSPVKLPQIIGFEFSTKYIPGSKFGGDYFDIFELEDRYRFGFIVASSSGYAMSSLLLSILIKNTFQIQAKKGLSPKKFLEMIHKEINEQATEKDSTSLFYGLVDRRDHSLVYCSVGYMDAYILRSNNSELDYLESCASPMMKGAESIFSEVRTVLNQNDRLIIATEGLAHSQNGSGQHWGADQLRDSIRMAPDLGVHELRNEILFCNKQFLGNDLASRDQTVFVMKMTEMLTQLIRVE